MKIHFVSGKGGVGKSLFSLGLARSLALQNKRVLLVELGDESFYSYLLDQPTIQYQPTPFEPLNLDIARWDGASALSEYVLHLIKVESIHRLFFENPITKSLVDAAPGLKELAILGKITSGPPRNVGPKLDYDCIVVDAFSSGHFFALLRAPMGMAETFRFGPMAEQSRGIINSINNPDITTLHIITIPEELPFQETCEMIHELPSVTPIKPIIWLNKWVTYPNLAKYLELNQLNLKFQSLDKSQENYFQQLTQQGCQVNKVHFHFDLAILSLVQKISKEIST